VQSQTGSQVIAYKTELNQRYWEYQAAHFPVWEKFFDRPKAQDRRPPVFQREEAWRNVIVSPNASPQEIKRLLAFVPVGERHKWFGSMNSSQALAQSVFGNLAVYGFLFKWQSHNDLLPCPLNKNYQLARNILAIGVKADESVSVDNGHVVVIYEERNPAFQEQGNAYAAYLETQAALRKPTMLRKCSWQRIIEHIRRCGSLPWLAEHIALKYGV
jgi:hypothetical protein